MSNFKYSLEICSQHNLGTIFQLHRSETVVGRGNVDISIDNPTLSTQHCLIRQNGSQVTVMDLQSRNGTLVNDQRILQETPLSSGDVLTLGEVSFRLTASISKEKLSTDEPKEKKSLFRGISSLFPSSGQKSSSYEKTTRNLLLFLAILSWVILLGPLMLIMQDEITKAKVERGVSLVTALAAANINAMQQGRQILVDTNIVDKVISS